MKPVDLYEWEMETSEGVILRQYNQDGTENTWKSLNIDKIVRVSFLPKIPLLPKHDCIIDISKGEKFIKRFGRGFLTITPDGTKMKEYINCVVTNNYRMYVFSTGKVIITRYDYEVYI